MDLIEVEYEVLPHVTDPVAAMQPDAVVLHNDLYTQTAMGKATTPSNVAEHLQMGRGDVGRGLAEAEVVIERTFRTQTVHQGYLEPDSEAAWMREDGSVIVWANTQTTFTQRQDLAIILGIPLSKIRVVPTEVGGAFGGKESVRVSALCVALSRRTGLPGAHDLQPCRSVAGHGARQRHGVHDQGRGPARWHHYRHPGASGL